MKILLRNATDYILFMLGLCGEVDISLMLDAAPASENHLRKQITSLGHGKIVRRHAYTEDSCFGSKRILRLAGAVGDGALSEVSAELLSHFNLIAGKKGQRYKGNKQHRERHRRLCTLCQMFYETGVSVDMLSHEFKYDALPVFSIEESMFSSYTKKKTIFDEEGNLLSPKEILTRAGETDTIFFTNRALSRMNQQKDERGKAIMCRSYGLLMRGPVMYNIYCAGDSGEIWWSSIERQMNMLTEKYKSDIFHVPKGGEGAAIIYTPNEEKAMNVFVPPKLIKNRINPVGVYGEGHILPLNQNHLDIRAMLLRKNWREETGRYLLKENYKKGMVYDGTINGYEVYNFLSNDMVHMTQAQQRIKTRPATVLIHDWQEPIAKSFFGSAVQMIKFTAAEFSALLYEIETAEEDI